MKLYIDTNVYLDFFLERRKSEHAFKIFKKTLKCKFYIILSDHILAELNNTMDLSDTQMLFSLLKPKIILVQMNEKDKNDAKLLNTHYADAIHIILATKAKADAIVTSNVKDFDSIFKTYSPEDL
jgi:predicted nucleic acid-binding protein